MSFSEDSSDPEWKDAKVKSEKNAKQELNLRSKAKYSQKFCEKWLKIFHPWLARCDDDRNKPFCRACQCRLDCNRCHLQRHERTSKHARNLDILVCRGEGAARQNLSIRQERSKYYQQRKKLNSSLASSRDVSDNIDAVDDYIEEYVPVKRPADMTDPEADTAFQFVQTDVAPGDQYTEETIMKQEAVSDSHNDLPRFNSKTSGLLRSNPKKAIKKERIQLLMQIQKDKNDLMESFKELMGTNWQQQTPKEKNHVDLFFDSVSSSVKALSPKLVAEAKMRVSQLMCELELRQLTENESNIAAGTISASSEIASPESVAVNSAYIINQPISTVGPSSGGHTTTSC